MATRPVSAIPYRDPYDDRRSNTCRWTFSDRDPNLRETCSSPISVTSPQTSSLQDQSPQTSNSRASLSLWSGLHSHGLRTNVAKKNVDGKFSSRLSHPPRRQHAPQDTDFSHRNRSLRRAGAPTTVCASSAEKQPATQVLRIQSRSAQWRICRGRLDQ